MLKAQVKGSSFLTSFPNSSHSVNVAEYPLNDSDLLCLIPWKTNILTALGVIDVSYYLRFYATEYAINKYHGTQGLENAMATKRQRTEIRKANKIKKDKQMESERRRLANRRLYEMGLTLQDLSSDIFPSYLVQELEEVGVQITLLPIRLKEPFVIVYHKGGSH
jgi:hypothetical protein